MSNSGYNNGYSSYPVQRQIQDPAICAAASPANQRHQLLLRPSRHSSAAGPTPTFSEPSQYPPSHCHSSIISQHSPAAAIGQHSLMTAPHPESHPSFHPYSMEHYSMPHGGAFLTAADLQIEPRSYYPPEVHHTMAMPYLQGSLDCKGTDTGYLRYQDGMSCKRTRSPSVTDSPGVVGSAAGVSEKAIDQPYAKLIFEALKNAPGHSMVLREIYRWFEVNTDKPQRAPAGKSGWKNSIRHNLSMNRAFEKITPATVRDREGNKGCTWKLSEDALADGGVQSTTRYRESKAKKKRQNSALLHQRCGDGGRVFKKSPTRELPTSHHESMLAHSAFDRLHQMQPQDAPSQELVPATPCYPYSGSHMFDRTGCPTATSQHSVFASSFSPDILNNFNLYDSAGTPSASSTLSEPILPEAPTSGPSPRIKIEDFEVEGVSNLSQGFDLFHGNAKQEASSEDQPLGPFGTSDGSMDCDSTSVFSNMPGLPLEEELCWPMGSFGPGGDVNHFDGQCFGSY